MIKDYSPTAMTLRQRLFDQLNQGRLWYALAQKWNASILALVPAGRDVSYTASRLVKSEKFWSLVLINLVQRNKSI